MIRKPYFSLFLLCLPLFSLCSSGNDDPAIVNKDAYGEGWIVKVKMSDPAEYDALLSAADYEKLIG